MTSVATRSLWAALFLYLLGGGAAGARAAHPEIAFASESAPTLNALSREDEEAGWKLLFNGRDLSGWRIRDSSSVPTGWVVRDSALAFAGRGPTSILSTEAFADFELTMEWKVGMGADAGIYLRVWNEKSPPSQVSPEVQLVDNLWNTAGMEPKQTAGACTHLYAPAFDATAPVGQWNRLKVTAVGGRVTHWLNDRKVVEYEIGSDDWRSRLSRSPLKAWPDLGSGTRGFIGLQQFSTAARFRNLKVRPLDLANGALRRHPLVRQDRLSEAGHRAFAWASAGGWGVRDLKGRALDRLILPKATGK